MQEKSLRELNYPYSQNGITIPEFCWKYLRLNAIECVLYGMMYSYKFINNTLENYCVITGVSSVDTIRKYLNNLVSEGLIAKRSVKINGTTSRVVYTNCYDKNGRLADAVIDANLDAGEKNLKDFYRKVNPIRMCQLRKKKSQK